MKTEKKGCGPEQDKGPGPGQAMLRGWRQLSEASCLLLEGSTPEDVKDLLIEGGKRIADYEQNRVIQRAYERMGEIGLGEGNGGAFLVAITAPLSDTPVPGGTPFVVAFPLGNIGDPDKRWKWVVAGLPGESNTANGPIKAWSDLSATQRASLAGALLEDGCKPFSRMHTLFQLDILVGDSAEAPKKQ